MKCYHHYSEHFLPVLIEKAMALLNLSGMSSPKMNFSLFPVTGLDNRINCPTIKYEISQKPGIQLNWLSENDHFQGTAIFKESQLPPYKKWEHTHTFVS